MKDARERFSATADDYAKWRPGYPEALGAWIAATTGVGRGARVVDVGCGTGISSRWLVQQCGYEVIGVDANEQMLAKAREAGGGVREYVRGEATATGLASGSAAMVCAAQAFHWFALEPAVAEFRRVTGEGGWSCAFWNLRARCAWNDLYEPLLLKWSSEYAKISDMSFDPRERVVAKVAGATVGEVAYGDRLGWEGVIGRVRSASYVVHGVADREGFEREVRAGYEATRGDDGMVEWRMRTVVVAWR